jgi:hypothetical protein
MIRVADSISNRAEPDRVLVRWVNLLIGALDEEWGARVSEYPTDRPYS